jgi:hypothetical protein
MLRPLRVLVSAAAALVVLGAAATTASAGVLVASAPSCDAQSLSRPFMPWADPMQYVLSPNGDFETGSWSTSGGAGVTAGNESFHVGGADHARSLSLPEGSSAQSAVMCVGIEHPTIRFFARQTGGSPVSGHLDVTVLFEDAAGNVRELQVAAAGAGSEWAPSAAYPLVVNLLPLLPGQATPVAFRFSAHGGNFQVDDVYVDPYGRG